MDAAVNTFFTPTGAVSVPVPSCAESGQQPGGPESPSESRDQWICTTGAVQRGREPGVPHVDPNKLLHAFITPYVLCLRFRAVDALVHQCVLYLPDHSKSIRTLALLSSPFLFMMNKASQQELEEHFIAV